MTLTTKKSNTLRFSLRTMGLLVVVIAILLGWLAPWERSARQKRRAATAIGSVGGKVWWDVQRSQPPPPTSAPRWLVKTLGPEYFGNVNMATTAESTDKHLRHLDSLPLVEILEVQGHSISAKALRRLSRLSQLEDLRLTGLDFPPSGLVHLQECQNLEVLWLIKTNVTGQRLRPLSGIDSMQYLVVVDSDFDDEDLLHLRDAKQLRHIHLGQTKVTAAGVIRLAPHLPECAFSVGDGNFALQPNGTMKNKFSFLPGEGLIWSIESDGETP